MIAAAMPKTRIHEYRGGRIVVSYDVARCIHAKKCVHGLPAVFDPERRPWVNADGAEPERIAEVVVRCPTGALRFERTDGGAQEAAPEVNTVTVAENGPLYLSGDLEIRMPDGEVRRENRAALCRCGASANKPYCDNAHAEIGFRDAGGLGQVKLAPAASEDAGDGAAPLAVKPSPNGPLAIAGPLELRAAAGGAGARGSRGALCRCGASANKPFCDGSHAAIGFEAD